MPLAIGKIVGQIELSSLTWATSIGERNILKPKKELMSLKQFVAEGILVWRAI